MTRPRRAAAAVAAAVVAVPLALSLGHADAMPAHERATVDTTGTDPTFTRHDVDTGVEGAAFTTVGEVFAGEHDILTSAWGPFDTGGRPTSTGSLFIYRPGDDLDSWTKVTVFGPEAGIIMPNATTVVDVDGDGDNDIIVPSGHFFGTDPGVAADKRFNSGTITWWENRGAGSAFVRHDVIGDQPGAYHGVQYVDLDGDGVKDIVSVSEEAKAPGSQVDDIIKAQFFKGNADHSFAAPVQIADVGGSQPVVADVDGDGDRDIVSSRYFDPLRGAAGGAFPAPSFLWLENSDTDGTLADTDFAVHSIAGVTDTSFGFQIQPIVGFRKPGKVSWIGTNHANRCTFAILFPAFAAREQVIEFKPGADIRAPWSRTTLSDPEVAPEPCPADYGTNRDHYPVWSDAITSRYGPGQGSPGTFNAGDVDGDGDIDLAVSGDGDRRLWWIENMADGTTKLHQLTADGEYFGQSGGGTVVDFDGDGTNEMVFSSWDMHTVAVWTPTGTVDVPVKVTSKLSASPARKTVVAGKKATWTVKLNGAAGPARTVTVTFDATKGKDLDLGSVTLGPAGGATQTGKLAWKPKTSGTLVFDYAGTTVSDMLSDTAAQGTAAVTVKKK